jgi:PAS domain S-box-containing protein
LPGFGSLKNSDEITFQTGCSICSLSVQYPSPETDMPGANFFESLFLTSPVALFVAGNDSTILRANRAACDMFGYTETEMLGLQRQQLLDYEDPSVCATLLQLKNREISRAEVTGIRKGGERFPIRMVITDVENENGEILTTVMAGDITNEKNQEKILRALLTESQQLHHKEEDSRKMLLNVLDSITDGFFILSNDWTVQYWNAAAERMLRKSAQELIGKNVWDSFPNLAFLREHPNFTIVSSERKSVQFRDYFKDYGIWAEVSIYPSDNSVSVYFKDITEVSRLSMLEDLEREVLEKNAKTGSVLEDILAFYMKRVEEIHQGLICSVVRVRNNRLYTWSAPSLSEKFCKKIDGLEIGDMVGCCGTAAFRKQKVVVENIETSPYWAPFLELARDEGLKACWSLPILDSRNNVIGTFASYYHSPKLPSPEEEQTLERVKNLLAVILENRLSIEEVEKTNQRYDLISRATNDAIWDWNVETGEVVKSGQGMKNVFGYEYDEVQAESDFWQSRVHPDDLKRFLDEQQKAMQDPAVSYWEHEYRFRKKDGSYAHVMDNAYIIRNPEGKAIRFMGAARDITDRKESEALMIELNNRLKRRADELAASNVELERFAYIASHDMQEPLRMITSFLQLFRKKYEAQIDETAEQYIHYAIDGADRMKKLIMDLLEYSRVGSNKDNFTDINTNELLQEVEKVFFATMHELSATIRVEPLPGLRGNRIQLFQLFQNLIGNALKYHGTEPPVITVSGREEEEEYVFSVSDNGIGIKPIFFEKIFVLFQRLHHKNEYSGTGIGLAICKKIVERHGGRIWVESEPGKGSTFHFSVSKNPDTYR